MKVIKNKKYAVFCIATVLVAGTLAFLNPPRSSSTYAEDHTGTDKAEAEWQWQINVKEVLSMSITKPSAGSTGNVDKFLRNKYSVSVSSNNGTGFTTGMTTKTTDTNLVHTTAAANTIATMSAAATCANADCAAFPANAWGYSLNDGSNTGTYNPMVGSNKAPITVLSSATQAATKSADVFFGAKANSSKASGTYKGTVIFTTTSGTAGSPLTAPSADPGNTEGPSANPGTSEQPSFNPSVAEAPSASSYSYSTGGRTYRSTPTSVTNATPATGTEEKKKTSTIDDFVSPLGANQHEDVTTSNVQHGSVVTTALLVVATTAAGVGIFFFVLAKKRDSEDEGDGIEQV